MSDQDKLNKLENLVKFAKEALEEAQKYADEHSLIFEWDNEYGCRKQTYVGKGHSLKDYKYYFEDEDAEVSRGEWMSSSDMCD